MVYKRYIKRGDKLFGPYYYESYRDEAGRTRTKLVSQPKKIFSIKLFLIISLTLLLTAGFVVLNKNLEESSSINPGKTIFGESKILGSIIKLIGFDVENEQQEIPEETESDTSASESSEEIAQPT